jgi:hypothetical protein
MSEVSLRNEYNNPNNFLMYICNFTQYPVSAGGTFLYAEN